MTDKHVDDLIRKLEMEVAPDPAFVSRTFDRLEPRVRRTRRDATHRLWRPQRWLVDGIAVRRIALAGTQPSVRWLLVAVALAIAVTGVILAAGTRPRLLVTVPPSLTDASPAPSQVPPATVSPQPSRGPAVTVGPNWRWVETGAMLEPRIEHTATLLRDGRVLVAGGMDQDGVILASAEIYDPATAIWAPTAPMNWTRYGHDALLLADGSVLVAGGSAPVSSGGSSAVVGEIWDPATGRWTETGPPVYGRATALASLHDGRVLVVGGTAPGVASGVFDPEHGTWTETGPVIVWRYNHALVALRDGSVLLAGGDHRDGMSEVPVTTLEVFDPGTGTWTAAADMAEGLDVRGGGILLPGGEVLIATSDWQVHLYDPSNRVVRPVARAPQPWMSQPALLADGTVLFNFGDSAGLFDPETRVWVTAEPPAESRYGGSATLLATGELLVTGGQSLLNQRVVLAPVVFGPGD